MLFILFSGPKASGGEITRFYDLSIGGAIYDKRLSLIVITVFVMHHRVRCLGVGYIYLSVYLYQYLCVAIYLKIILVVHLMVSANSLAVHFIDSAPYGSLSTYLIFGQAIRCTIIYFLVTIGQLMIFAQPPHYYAILS